MIDVNLEKGVSKIFETQREVLNARREMVQLRIKQYELLETMCEEREAPEVAALVKEKFLFYFEQELTSIDYLQKCLDDCQARTSETVARWLAEHEEAIGEK